MIALYIVFAAGFARLVLAWVAAIEYTEVADEKI